MSRTLQVIRRDKEKSIKDKLKLALKKEQFLKDNLHITKSVIYFEKNIYINKESLKKLYESLKDKCKE